MKTAAYTLLLVIAGFVSCAKHKTPEPSSITVTDTVSFSQFVLPLMQTNCTTSGCHDAASGSGGYVLDNYADISANATAALGSMTGANGVQPMPQGMPSLPNTDIAKFQAWISQGKLNN